MKQAKVWIIIVVFFLSFTPAAATYVGDVPGDTIVYVTDTGTKYHRPGCTYLKSKNRTTKEAAENTGYSPCSRCKPQLYVGEYTGAKNSGSGSGSSGEGGDKRTLGIDPLPEDENVNEKIEASALKEDEEGNEKNANQWDGISEAIVMVLIFAIIPVWCIAEKIKENRKQSIEAHKKKERQKREETKRKTSLWMKNAYGDFVKVDADRIEEFEAEQAEIERMATERMKRRAEEQRKLRESDRLPEDYWAALLEDVEQREKARERRRRDKK